MTMKLIQKSLFKGRREFEISGDMITARRKGLGGTKELHIALSSLDPEPVAIGAELAYFSHPPRRTVFALQIDQPDADTFRAFVDVLAERIRQAPPDPAAQPAAAGASRPPAPGWNVYDEPEDFAEPDEQPASVVCVPVNAERLGTDIDMLRSYLTQDELNPLLERLEILRAAPADEAAFRNVVDAFQALGIHQGAVLTYAPYLKVLLSKSLRP